MDLETRRKIESNLFPSSQAAIDDWEKFLWHKSNGEIDTWQINSSQALAIDVFGTLKATFQAQRNWILNAIAAEMGLPAAEDWTIELEWNDPANLLRETGTLTQVDAVASSSKSIIFFECKFTEKDGGSCSQWKPRTEGPNKGQVQCNGRYMEQENPIYPQYGGHRCALAAKGIRYWEVMPEVLIVAADTDHDPCPFKGPWYQWMRNLTVAWELARKQERRPGFAVVYADGPNLPMARKIQGQDKDGDWAGFCKAVRTDRIPFQTHAYQTLIRKAREAISRAGGNDGCWKELQEWVEYKIAAVNAQRALS